MPPTPTDAGYTLLGAPTVTADLSVTGEFAYVAARLVDVDPVTNTKTLVARGVYRIDANAPNGRQTFRLHPNGWHFAPGHIPQLELLGQDPPYLRPSNGQFSIEVSNLRLRLPVHEVSGAPGTPPGGQPARRWQRGTARVLPPRPLERLAGVAADSSASSSATVPAGDAVCAAAITSDSLSRDPAEAAS